MIRTRDVIFNENSHYQSHEINVIQLINEFFLRNDTLKILQIDFTKLIEIEFDSDEELFELTSTEILVVCSSNDEKTKKAITKNDKNYLPSSISFFFEKKKHFTNFIIDVFRASFTVIFWTTLIIRNNFYIFLASSLYTFSVCSHTAWRRKRSVKKFNSFSKAQFVSLSISHRFNNFNRRKTSILQIIHDIKEEEKKTISRRALIEVKILSLNA